MRNRKATKERGGHHCTRLFACQCYLLKVFINKAIYKVNVFRRGIAGVCVHELIIYIQLGFADACYGIDFIKELYGLLIWDHGVVFAAPAA